MSLFGSLYDEHDENDASDLPEIEVDAPGMRLEDLAAELFDAPSPNEQADEHADEPAAHDSAEPEGSPSGFSVLFDETAADVDPESEDHVPRTPAPAGSLASAASDLADLAKSPVATMAPPAAAQDEEGAEAADGDPLPGAFDEANGSGTSDAEAEFAEPLLIDDLLPSSKPAGAGALPSLNLSGGVPLKLIVVLFVAAIAGFVGIRMLTGGSSDASSDGASPGGAITSPADALDAVQLTGAETELRNAAVAAAAEYANTGTFARSASDWGAVLPEATVQDGTDATPSQDALLVVSDADAVCFETLLANGTTVAAGVTATTRGFFQDPGGSSVCTTDAAVIEGWSPSLLDV